MATTHTTPSRVTVLLAAVGIGILLLLATASAATGTSGAPPEPTTHVVSAGDTLWSIAQQTHGPDADTRRVVHAIKELNGLDGAAIGVGQVLLVPAVTG